MRRMHGTIVAVLVLPVLVLGVVAAAYVYSIQRLPHPREADREQLLRWLVLRDLRSEPPDVGVALVDRLQDELSDEAALNTADVRLGDDYRRRLRDNMEFLKRVWFATRCRQYQDCPAGGRLDFLVTQIDFIQLWSDVDVDVLEDEVSGARDESATVGQDARRERFAQDFFENVDRWIEQARAPMRDWMKQAVRDGVVCWLATGDLSGEPLGTRRELAARIVRQFEAGLRLDEISLDLTPQRRDSLRTNSRLLMEAWLHDQAEIYHGLPQEERLRFVDGRIDDVIRWRLLDLMTVGAGDVGDSADASPTAQSSTEAMKQLAALGQAWIERASEERRAVLSALLQHVQQRLFFRRLTGDLPYSNE